MFVIYFFHSNKIYIFSSQDINVDLLVKDVVDATTQCSFETDVNLLTNALYPERTTDDELLTMNSCYNDIVYHLLNLRRENNCK